MTTNLIHLYEMLRKNVGDASAEAIATFINSKIERCRQKDAESLASKTDLHKAVGDLRIELKQDMNDLRLDISGLSEKISDIKTDVTRWAFAIFVTVALAFIGLYLKK